MFSLDDVRKAVEMLKANDTGSDDGKARVCLGDNVVIVDGNGRTIQSGPPLKRRAQWVLVHVVLFPR